MKRGIDLCLVSKALNGISKIYMICFTSIQNFLL